MALSKNTKRFQITLNSSKEKDKFILDYLEQSYNENDKIKELLYIAIVNQKDSKIQTVSNNTKKLLTKSNNDTKKVKVSNSKKNKKLLTVTDSVTEKATGTNSDNTSKLLTKSKDKLQEVNESNEATLRENELEELKKFM